MSVALTAALVLAHALVHAAGWFALLGRARWPRLLAAAVVPVLVPLYLWEARERSLTPGWAAWALALVCAWALSLGLLVVRLALV